MAVAALVSFTGTAYPQMTVTYRTVKDSKTIGVVAANTEAAEAAELIYHNELDTIAKERVKLSVKATLKNLVKQGKMYQQTFLGDIGRQKAAFSMLVRKCKEVTDASLGLLTEAKKHPERMLYCTRTVIEFGLQAEDAVEKCVKIAMGARVKNPLTESKDDGGKKEKEKEEKKDGYNLVYPDERLAIIYDTVDELNRISAAMTVLSYTLMTKYTWKEAFADLDPEGYRILMDIDYTAKDISGDLKRLPWW